MTEEYVEHSAVGPCLHVWGWTTQDKNTGHGKSVRELHERMWLQQTTLARA